MSGTGTPVGCPKAEEIHDLAGSKHDAYILHATNGVLFVSLTILNVDYKGVLLDTTNGLIPNVVHAPQMVEVNDAEALEMKTAYLKETEENDTGYNASSTTLRHTYLSECDRNLPCRSITSSIYRTRNNRKMRPGRHRIMLCSMCKTHCYEDQDSPEPINSPSIRISFKSASGDSANVLEISPKKIRKDKKHKRKKHKKHKHKEIGNEIFEIRPLDSASGVPEPALKTEKIIEPDIPLQPASRRIKRRSTSSNITSAPTKRTKMVSKAHETVVSEKLTRNVLTYSGADGKHINVGDVIWGKIVGFPWWPGRVCDILVTENHDGIIMEHVADIDWYASPTRSSLPCSQIYPFLDEFEKRFTKKKTNATYKKAISQAKYDAVCNAQYEEQSSEEESAHDEPQSEIHNHQPASPVGLSHCDSPTDNRARETTSDSRRMRMPRSDAKELKVEVFGGSSATADEPPRVIPISPESKSDNSPSMLIDVFLRNEHQSSSQSQATLDSDLMSAILDNDSDHDALTIALPSPESILESGS